MGVVKTKALHEVRQYGAIVIGSVIVALGLDMFLIPNRIAPGGVSGLATVVHHVIGWPVGVTMLIAEVPLFLSGLRIVGRQFGIKTLVGAVTTAVSIDVLAPFVPIWTSDPALASIYGGLLVGVGIGITFRYGGSTGGTDLAARILNHYTNLSIGRSLLVFDGLVIILAGMVFEPELALYAFLAVFLASKTIDVVQEGPRSAKSAMIVSSCPEAIGKRVLAEMERGATALKAKGVYTSKERDVLLVIVSRYEIQHLRRIVREEDEKAFVIISDVSEVLGEGFTPLPNETQSNRKA